MKHLTGALTLGILLVPLAAGAQVETASAIADAAKQRNVKLAAALIKQGADVNVPHPDGATALHWAAHWDDVPLAQVLIRAGAKVDAVNDYGVMPLWLAAANGSAAMIDRLLKARANPDATLPTGETVLMTAARIGKLSAVQRLLAAGAKVNRQQLSKQQTALMWAAAEQHVEVVRALLDAGADIEARTSGGFTPLMFAARELSLAVVQLLVERGADVGASAADGSTPLLVATVRGHVPTALYLLERGAPPDGSAEVAGYTPLHYASGTFEATITHDYPNAPGEWAALAGIPVREDKIRLIRALLAHGASVHAKLTKLPPRYGLHYFAVRGDFITGGTPFYLAAQVADLDVMRILLAAGSDPGIVTDSGTTALMVAAGYYYLDEESLIPKSAYLEATKLMLDLGADIHAANNRGYTPLHCAALVGLNHVVQFLVDKGANINAKNKRGETPLDVAEGYNGYPFHERPATGALLRKLGAVGGVNRSSLLAGATAEQVEQQKKSIEQEPK